LIYSIQLAIFIPLNSISFISYVNRLW